MVCNFTCLSLSLSLSPSLFFFCFKNWMAPNCDLIVRFTVCFSKQSTPICAININHKSLPRCFGSTLCRMKIVRSSLALRSETGTNHSIARVFIVLAAHACVIAPMLLWPPSVCLVMHFRQEDDPTGLAILCRLIVRCGCNSVAAVATVRSLVFRSFVVRLDLVCYRNLIWRWNAIFHLLSNNITVDLM